MTDHIFRFLIFLAVLGAGFLCVPLMINLLIKVEILNGDTTPEGFIEATISQAIFIWMGTGVLAFISLFITKNWRLALLLSPLIVPSFFVVVYTVAKI